MNLEIIDVPGRVSTEMLAIRQNAIKRADGIILVYSVPDRTSYELIPSFRSQITSTNKVPVVLVGTMTDLPASVKKSEAEKYSASVLNCDYFEISATCGTKIVEPVCSLIRQIRKSTAIREKMAKNPPKSLANYLNRSNVHLTGGELEIINNMMSNLKENLFLTSLNLRGIFTFCVLTSIRSWIRK